MSEAERNELDASSGSACWYDFDPAKGSRQKRPPIKKLVLVRTVIGKWEYDGKTMEFITDKTLPVAVAVGYRKDAAGDKQSPMFVVPGVGGQVIAWRDCLPSDVGWEVFKQNA